jgi:hypothetical protein
MSALSAAIEGVNNNGRILIASHGKTFNYPLPREIMDMIEARGLKAEIGNGIASASQIWGSKLASQYGVDSWIYLTFR